MKDFQDIQGSVGYEQFELLKSFLGTGPDDAKRRATAWARWAMFGGRTPPSDFTFTVPTGLKRDTIDAYERLSDTMIKLDRAETVRTQHHRQELCEHAMTVLRRQNRDRF